MKTHSFFMDCISAEADLLHAKSILAGIALSGLGAEALDAYRAMARACEVEIGELEPGRATDAASGGWLGCGAPAADLPLGPADPHPR